MRLPAGERYDVVFAMSPRGAALLVDDRRDGGLRLVPEGGAAPATAEDGSGWPEFDPLRYGAPAATAFGAASRFDRAFTMVLDQGPALVGGVPAYAQTVGGRAFPAFPAIPAQLVREGDLIRVTVVNRGRDTPPWHPHGHTVLVLARDGTAPSGSPLWLDTFDVRPGEVWEVAFRAANPCVWMNHCHNLAHADQGMAPHLRYKGVTSPSTAGTAAGTAWKFHGGAGRPATGRRWSSQETSGDGPARKDHAAGNRLPGFCAYIRILA